MRRKLNVTRSLKSNLLKRSKNIKSICEQNKVDLIWKQNEFRRDLRNHIWDFAHGLVYCPIAKVASTTWFINFLKLANINLQGLQSLQKSGNITPGEMQFVKKTRKGKLPR